MTTRAALAARVATPAARAAVAILAVLLLAGCGQATTPPVPFGPCGEDARAPGAYPELEVIVPPRLDDLAPTAVDSGRSCSQTALGTLWGHGIRELRFAGGTWSFGGADAAVIAALFTPTDQPFPQEPWVEEFYEAGARAGRKTDNIATSRPEMGEAGEVFRLDALNDLSLQSVVVWDQQGAIHVVIVATEVVPGKERAVHDQRVERAVAASAAWPE